jgi:hypothetical protein
LLGPCGADDGLQPIRYPIISTEAAGGAFAGTTSAEVLKLVLGIILAAAAFKAFWRQG